MDDPQLCHPEATVWWELAQLERDHFDMRVRDAAAELAATVEE